MSILAVLQDPNGVGGAATVVRTYRQWMDCHRPDERCEYFLDETSSTRDFVLRRRSWDHQSSPLPRLLPRAQVTQYGPARRMLRGITAEEGHVIGASVIHGTLIPDDIPTLLWCATTIRDERASSTRGRGIARRTTYALALPTLERLEREVLIAASRVLAMSGHTARCLVNAGAKQRRVEVVPVPIDTSKFAPGVMQRRGVLFVGRIDDPRKGFDRLPRLVAASDVVQAHGVNVIAPVPGRQIRLPHGITLLGQPVDIVSAHRSAEVLVLPSRQEGLGIVAFEALSCGTPVVATRCGGPDEMLEASGGAVVVEEPHELAPALELLLMNPARREEMGACGRQWVIDNMSLSRFLADSSLFTLS